MGTQAFFIGKVEKNNSLINSDVRMALLCKGLYISITGEEDNVLLELCNEGEKNYMKIP